MTSYFLPSTLKTLQCTVSPATVALEGLHFLLKDTSVKAAA